MEKIIIKLKKKKIIPLFLGSILFVFLSFFLIRISYTEKISSPIFMRIFSVFGIIFFGFCGFYYMMKLFDKKPGLVIYDEGIIDNSSAISPGLIKWQDIIDIFITEINNQKFLTFEIKNPDELVSKQKGLKKILMTINKNYFRSPIHISSSILDCDFQELHDKIQAQFSIHRAPKKDL